MNARRGELGQLSEVGLVSGCAGVVSGNSLLSGAMRIRPPVRRDGRGAAPG
jgi:hypothetical protein